MAPIYLSICRLNRWGRYARRTLPAFETNSSMSAPDLSEVTVTLPLSKSTVKSETACQSTRVFCLCQRQGQRERERERERETGESKGGGGGGCPQNWQRAALGRRYTLRKGHAVPLGVKANIPCLRNQVLIDTAYHLRHN